MPTLLFSSNDIKKWLPMRDCIDAVEDALRALGDGTANPPSTLSVHQARGNFHIKAGSLQRAGRHYFAAKTNGNFPGNSANGLPTIQGVLLLCDADDGRVLALMDSIELTALRTAAATAVAARLFAGERARTASLIGCGRQAPAQIEALRAVLPLERVLVYDRDTKRAADFARTCEAEVVENLTEATRVSDVVVTCTTSTEFLLFPDHVHGGMFIAGVGVDNEGKRELSPELMRLSRVVTDVTAQCALIGDLHHAIDAGAMTAADVYGELPALLAARTRGTIAADEIVIFDSTGIGIQDVAAAAAVYESAVANGVENISSIELS